MSATETLFGRDPFSLGGGEKRKVFTEAMRESLKMHYEKCEGFRRFLDRKGFDPWSAFSTEDIPLIHVDIFKKLRLLSVPENDIVRTVKSSSTTGGTPSTVFLDRTTVERQRRALSSIMSSFIGPERKTLMVLDGPQTVKSADGSLSSRASGIRGMLPFSRKVFYVLDDELKPDRHALREAVGSVRHGDEVCIFGFTYILYGFVTEVRKDPELMKILKRLDGAKVVHTGGWKKLSDMKIDKKEFNDMVAGTFGTEASKVTDMYGMTEQLGTVYPDCEYGYKHVPAFSDIIIRDPLTLKPAENGTKGFIQLLSPLPNSYPGISIVTDDMGVIVGDDGCKCGRKGKYFLFSERIKKSEIKGCGDTIGE